MHLLHGATIIVNAVHKHLHAIQIHDLLEKKYR